MKSPYQSPKTNPERNQEPSNLGEPVKLGKKRIIVIGCCLILPILLFILILFRKQSLLTG